MTDSDREILAAAERRGADMGLPFGAILPPEAHALMRAGAATVVDVRTQAELHFVGRIPNAPAIEWQRYPSGERNQNFIAELKTQVAADQPILFICRSGVRSAFAAAVAAENGFRAFNILQGFEGDADDAQQRGNKNGWRFHNLPWTQS